MTYKLKVSSQNQVTIPKDIISELGIVPGMYLYLNQSDNGYTIQDVRKTVQSLAGSLSKYVKDKRKFGISDEDLEFAIEESKSKHFKNRAKDQI